MQVLVKEFRSKFLEKQQPGELAAEFTTQVGPRRLINISSMLEGRVVHIYVWYWSDDPVSLDAHDWKGS